MILFSGTSVCTMTARASIGQRKYLVVFVARLAAAAVAVAMGAQVAVAAVATAADTAATAVVAAVAATVVLHHLVAAAAVAAAASTNCLLVAWRGRRPMTVSIGRLTGIDRLNAVS
jgi:hypothetical protein